MIVRLNAWIRRIDGRSFTLGLLVGLLPVLCIGPAEAFSLRNFGSMGRNIGKVLRSLGSIKSGLDGDVKSLGEDAKLLFADVGNLLEIKNKLTDLATQTQGQIASITNLVTEVEGHIRKTQDDIKSTAKNVARIDGARQLLGLKAK